MHLPKIALAVAALSLITACTSSKGDSPAVTAPTVSATRTLAPTTAPPTTATAGPSPTASASPTPDELSPKPGLETAAPLGQPTCKGSDLTVTDADTLVGASYRKEVFAVRTQGADCQLKGYPAVQIHGVTTRHGGFGLAPEQPKAVTLSRSTSLSFMISSTRTGSCRTISTVVVTLPMTTGGHRISTSFQVCGSAVGLSPVHRQGESD